MNQMLNQLMSNFGNLSNLANSITQYKSQLGGDPEQIGRDMLNSGQLNQSQFQTISQLATQIQKMFMGR